MESSPKIAIVGFSARAAVQCAKRQGFEIIAVDLCSDRDLLSDCQKHYQLNDPNWPPALSASHPNVPILFTGGMENRIELVEQCQTNGLVLTPNASSLRAMRSLDNCAAWAVSCNLGWPATLRTIDEIRSCDELFPGRKWLAKPFSSAGGIGITEWIRHEGDDHASFIDPAKSFLQERLPGESIGVTFLSSNVGGAVVGATASWKSGSWNSEASCVDGPIYAYQGSYGPISLSSELLAKLQRFATLVGAESGLLGLWQADFLLHDNELTLLEINPRWSASMDLLDVCNGIPLVQIHHACVCDHLSEERFSYVASQCFDQAKNARNTMLGKLIVYSPKSFVVTSIQSDKWWTQRWSCGMNFAAKRFQFADIPNAGTSVAQGDPLLTVVVPGCSPEALMIELQRGRIEALDDLEGMRRL